MFHLTMRDGILILLLVLAFVLVCLAAHLYGRRLRARARNALEVRHWQLRAVLVVIGIVFLGEIVIALNHTNQVMFVSLLLTVGFAIVFGILLRQFLQTRKQLHAQSGFV